MGCSPHRPKWSTANVRTARLDKEGLNTSLPTHLVSSYQAGDGGLGDGKDTVKAGKGAIPKDSLKLLDRTFKEGRRSPRNSRKTTVRKISKGDFRTGSRNWNEAPFSPKTVTFSFSEPYDLIPSLLASRHLAHTTTCPSHSDKTGGCAEWCPRQDLNLYDVTH